ncbi:hypothetical protein CR513_17041, partial [Mucuna pruriens]
MPFGLTNVPSTFVRGLTNVPSTFMRLMNHFLRSLIGHWVVVYFDDILVSSTCVDDHIVHYPCCPLNEIIKKDVGFKWEETQEKSFQALKDTLTNAPILALPNFHKSFKLECDMSNMGVRLRSCKLKHYLLSNEFIVHCDHESIKHLRGQHKLNKRHAKWVKFLEQFLYVIKHKDLYLGDDDFKEAYELYANSVNRCFFRHEGILFKEKRFCVPKSSIRELLVKKAHEGDLMGHFGDCKIVRPYMSIFTASHEKRYASLL